MTPILRSFDYICINNRLLHLRTSRWKRIRSEVDNIAAKVSQKNIDTVVLMKMKKNTINLGW